MSQLVEVSRRLVLNYDPGQFTFRNFDALATDQQLYDLAHQLNSFQEDDVAKVLKVQEFQFRF
ncbi:MAG: DUF1659 domain-containing protein [Defluviitaleaceae bacterium]|nr:DUF1659 domain-containing protein [Defluviitaleaceae bacterium]